MTPIDAMLAVVKNGSNLHVGAGIPHDKLETLLEEARRSGAHVVLDFQVPFETMEAWSKMFGKHVTFYFPPHKN